MTWEGLNPPYRTIVADPPWHYETTAPGWRLGQNRSSLAYSTMSIDEISALRVHELANPGAHLYLWTTNHHLESAFGVMRSWGFVPSTTLVWCKPPRAVGAAGRYTVTTEFVIYGTAPSQKPLPREVQRAGRLIREAREAAGLGRTALHHRVKGGTPTRLVNRWENDESLPNAEDWKRLQAVLPLLADVPRPEVPPPPTREPREVERHPSTWFQWPVGAHSAKPPAFLDVVESVSPGPYVELFAREPRLGWDHWGFGYETERVS